MVWAVAIWMGIAPGSLIAFAIPSSLPATTRLALSVALSPAVVACGFLLLLRLGLGEQAAAISIAVASAPGAWWIARALSRDRPAVSLTLISVVLLAIVWVVAHWAGTQDLRLFGWHNVMHVDAIQSLLRSGGIPEEPELAGRPIGYGWLGLSAAAATSALAGRPATLFFPVSNLLLLVATLALVSDAAIRIGLGRVFAAAAAVFALMSGHLLREIALLFGAAPLSLIPIFGDVRLNVPISKFLYMDLMPMSFAVLAGFLSSTLHARATGRPGTAVVATLCLTILAGLYPAALPAALSLVVGALVGELAAGDPEKRPAGFALLAGIAASGVLVQLLLMQLGSAPGGLFSDGEMMAWKARHSLVAIGLPLLLLGMLALWVLRDEGLPLRIGLGFSVAILMLAYVVLDVSGLEYKLVMYARMPLGLLAAAGLAAIVSHSRDTELVSWKTAVALGVPVAVAGLSLAASLSSHGPANLRFAPPVDESQQTLALAATSPDRAWVEALKQRTPPDTVVLADRIPFQLGAFSNRSLYFPASRSGQAIAGYGLEYRYNLVRVRGHPTELLRQREQALRFVMGPSTAPQFADSLARIRQLGRPIAIITEMKQRPRMEALLAGLPAEVIHQDSDRTVWLIDGPLEARN